jgi:hypothetical protein
MSERTLATAGRQAAKSSRGDGDSFRPEGGYEPPYSDNFRPGDACPYLLTPNEAVRYMRLDLMDIKNPLETLQRYRKEGHLKGTQVSKCVFYQRKHIDAFLDKMTEINPR